MIHKSFFNVPHRPAEGLLPRLDSPRSVQREKGVGVLVTSSPRQSSRRQSIAHVERVQKIGSLRNKVARLAAIIKNQPQGLDSVLPSQLPPSFLRRHSLSMNESESVDQGALHSSHNEALALADIHDELVSTATQANVSNTKSKDEIELSAMDIIFSEIIRQEMSRCVERGVLLSLIRDRMTASIRANGEHTTQKEGKKSQPPSPTRHVVDTPKSKSLLLTPKDKSPRVALLEEKLDKAEEEIHTLRQELERVTRLNSLLSTQRTHEAVLNRALSRKSREGSSSSLLHSQEVATRAMILDTVAKTALTLKRVKCETKGEIEGMLLLKERADRAETATQTSDEGLMDAFYSNAAFKRRGT